MNLIDGLVDEFKGDLLDVDFDLLGRHIAIWVDFLINIEFGLLDVGIGSGAARGVPLC